MSKRPAVVFVAGWGRSGSTVLNRILARDGVLGLGEVRWLWRRGIAERQDCSCGNPWDGCDVWQPAVTSVATATGMSPSACAEVFDRAALRAGRTATLPGAFQASRAAQDYVSALRNIYVAAAEAADTSVVVDSSKAPTQALLARLTGLPVSVVHLVRDPRAVVWSHRRRKAPPVGIAAGTTPTRPGAYVAGRWLARNAFIDARVRPELRLRYEDLIADPHGAVAQIFASIGHPVPPGSDGVEHVIAGNPSRFETGPLILERDDEWVHAQPAGQRHVATAIAAPLLSRYGYPWATRR